MKTYTFDYPYRIQNIVLVGCGGTGGQIARSLARMVYDMQNRNLQAPDLTFIDPDVVESKNVGRQLFAPAHIGMNKAQALAQQFNFALGLDIRWIDAAFIADEHIPADKYDRSNRTALIIGAVDNHLARCELAASKTLWLDCGNDYDTGQIVLGSTDNLPEILRKFKLAETATLNALPYASLLFPALLEAEDDPEPQPDVSCAELLEQGSQHLLINDLVSTCASQYIYKLLHRQPISSFMTYVSASSLSVRSLPICWEEMCVYLHRPQTEAVS